MIVILLQMAAIAACGVLWGRFAPAGLAADPTRRAITGVVYYLLLPALVLRVLWQAPLGVASVQIAAAAASGVLVGLALQWAMCRVCTMDRAATGALLLAAAFPNATYLGLPVLEGVMGEWARSVAIQYDLFACTPLLLTVGIGVAQYYGTGGERGNAVKRLAAVPALWAALLAVVLNVAGAPVPEWFGGMLDQMASGVVPFMLLAVGMGLNIEVLRSRRVMAVLPVAVVQLALMPLVVWGVAAALGLSGEVLKAVVLEGAMPAMLIGVVLCDRYRLDTGLYAAAVTVTTLLSLFTLPLWYGAG